MYLDFLVEIPDVKGKITYRKKDDLCYVYFEYDRIYDPQRQYTNVRRVMIGKRSPADPLMMHPNQNYLKYFPEVELPKEKSRAKRSCCLRVGGYLFLKKIICDSGIPAILSQYFSEEDMGLFLDLASYSIISESNAAQYYPDYTYNHALFTERMKIYSDSKISQFFQSITDDQSIGFLNSWNESKDHKKKVYFSYGLTNKDCRVGEIEMLEYGKAKVNQGLLMFKYAIAYDMKNREPLFYEAYPESINDVSQLRFLIDKANGYGYEKIGFILDRGYFSKGIIEYMDQHGYSFVIMVKGMASFVNQIVLEHKGTFEKKRVNNISEYRVYGITIKRKLYATDEKERYFHIYHSIDKENVERNIIENRIEAMTKFMKSHKNEMHNFGSEFEKYFELYDSDEEKTALFPVEKAGVIESEINLCGYFCIITSDEMTAKEAINLYKSRDASEKLFRGDKSYLGEKSLRAYMEETASAKIFMEFIALIIRSRIYTGLKDEMNNPDKGPDDMIVPAAIKELEKIEMARQLDHVYRLDHAVTATQKTILKAFGADAAYVKYKASEISEVLKNEE